MKFVVFLLGFLPSLFAEQPQTQTVPMRIDLGVERCTDRCRRTPYLGENVDVEITLIKTTPETWAGQWQGDISYDGRTYNGSVDLFVEATPNGYVFKVIKTVDGSRHIDWLPNLSVLKINETQSQLYTVDESTTHRPYLITGPKYN